MYFTQWPQFAPLPPIGQLSNQSFPTFLPVLPSLSLSSEGVEVRKRWKTQTLRRLIGDGGEPRRDLILIECRSHR